MVMSVDPPKDKAIMYSGDETPVLANGYIVNILPHL
jgi:hypothetical protein